MRRPLLGIVACYLAGVFIGARLTCPDFASGLILALAALTLASVLHFSLEYFTVWNRIVPPAVNALVFMAVFVAGWLTVDLRLQNHSARDLTALMDKPREGVELMGIISDDPALRTSWRDGEKYWSFSMEAKTIARVGIFQKARGEVQVILPQNELQPRYGELWRLSGVLVDKYRYPDLSPEGQNRIFLAKRFLFQVEARSVPVRMRGASRLSFLYWCFLIREKCSLVLSRGIEHRPEVVAILQALVLGRQHELPLAMREAFVATGTYHIFAISGQHVAIIALFVVFILRFHGVCLLNWFYYIAPVLVVFTVMTGMSASAVRGCIMALMCFLGPLFKRKTDISSAMALAALLIVGADPLQLFQTGFLLSFGIVAGLIVLCPPLIAMSERRLAPDPYRLEPENLPARHARKIIRWILFMLIASFASWLVSAPLIARWFNLVSPVALAANLLVIPLATLVLLAGCLSIAFGWFCPFIAEIFNFTNVFLVSLMSGLTIKMAQIPFGHIFVQSPPLWLMSLWFFTLLVWRLYYRQKKIWIISLLFLMIAVVLFFRLNAREWEVHLFNLDQRAVCLFKTAKAKSLLINTGSEYQGRNLLRYLRTTGLNRIAMLALPLADPGHAGAAADLIAALPVNNVRTGAANRHSRLVRDIYAAADQRGINTLSLTNENWQIQPDRNGWQVNGGVAADRLNPNWPEGCGLTPDSPVAISLNADLQSGMVARIIICGRQKPVTIDVAETPIPEREGSENHDAPPNEYYRIICRPAAENRERQVYQASGNICLGPGQGVVIQPGRAKIIITPANLFPN